MTYYDILKDYFPNLKPLDTEFYTEEPYKSNPLRRCKILILSGSMSNYDAFNELSHQDQNGLIKKIESGCINIAIKKTKEDNITCSWQTRAFVCRYNNIIHEKAMELDYNSNKYLAPRVISGEINPYKVGALTPEEANPDHNILLKEKSEIRKNQTVQVKTSTMYECPNCSKRTCTVVNVQIRGLDEAKSTIATCCYCDHEWMIEL